MSKKLDCWTLFCWNLKIRFLLNIEHMRCFFQCHVSFTTQIRIKIFGNDSQNVLVCKLVDIRFGTWDAPPVPLLFVGSGIQNLIFPSKLWLKVAHPKILLMVQKSQTTTRDVFETVKNNRKYPYQLVSRISEPSTVWRYHITIFLVCWNAISQKTQPKMELLSLNLSCIRLM